MGCTVAEPCAVSVAGGSAVAGTCAVSVAPGTALCAGALVAGAVLADVAVIVTRATVAEGCGTSGALLVVGVAVRLAWLLDVSGVSEGYGVGIVDSTGRTADGAACCVALAPLVGVGAVELAGAAGTAGTAGTAGIGVDAGPAKAAVVSVAVANTATLPAAVAPATSAVGVGVLVAVAVVTLATGRLSPAPASEVGVSVTSSQVKL